MSSQPELVFVADGEGDSALALVVNFGVYAGREATPAEIRRLAGSLLERLEAVEIVSENRYEVSREAEATVHRLRVEVASADSARVGSLREAVAAWAADCIDERRVGA
ncbi:MAG TPA: hypothetical protein VK915_14080 [Gaiellaceae bacterium]|nr:hypothetical protein [Gaiellaceae bacterium]